MGRRGGGILIFEVVILVVGRQNDRQGLASIFDVSIRCD